jgi:hypothetical protein
VLSEKGAPTPVAWTRMRVPRSLMASIGDDAIRAAARESPLFERYGQTVEQEPRDFPAPSPGEAPPLPDNADVPPMPAPAEPKGPAIWEEVLKHPTVRSGINTAIREAVKGLFGTGRRRR